MFKTPLIINISRGKVINENSLVYALEKELVSGAGLDVFEEEPISRKNKLLKFNNCILSSHNAFNTTEAVERVNNNTIKNLIKGLQ